METSLSFLLVELLFTCSRSLTSPLPSLPGSTPLGPWDAAVGSQLHISTRFAQHSQPTLCSLLSGGSVCAGSLFPVRQKSCRPMKARSLCMWPYADGVWLFSLQTTHGPLLCLLRCPYNPIPKAFLRLEQGLELFLLHCTLKYSLLQVYGMQNLTIHGKICLFCFIRMTLLIATSTLSHCECLIYTQRWAPVIFWIQGTKQS